MLFLALTALFGTATPVSLTAAPANAATASHPGVLYTCRHRVPDPYTYRVSCTDSGNTRYRAVARCSNGPTVRGSWVYAPFVSTAKCYPNQVHTTSVQFECEVVCASTPNTVTDAESARAE